MKVRDISHYEHLRSDKMKGKFIMNKCDKRYIQNSRENHKDKTPYGRPWPT